MFYILILPLWDKPFHVCRVEIQILLDGLTANQEELESPLQHGDLKFFGEQVHRKFD